MRVFSKKSIVVVVSIIAIAVVSVGTYIWRDERITAREVETVMHLGAVRRAFHAFREQQGRWPDSFDEVPINEYMRVDALSKQTFCVVTQKNLYCKGVRPLDQVLVMQPKPYRSHPWPFGEPSLIVVTGYGIYYVTPSEVINKAEIQGAASP